MIDPGVLAVFMIAVVVLTLTPGPDMALLVGRGVGQGRKVAALTAVGFTLAGVIQIPLLALGIDTLFRTYPGLYGAMQLGGAIYLIWRGIKLFRAATPNGAPAMAVNSPTNAAAALQEGMIASLLNPKGLIFLVAFLPQFADPSKGNIALQISILALIMKAVALAIELPIALAAGSFGHWIARHPKLIFWQERLTGLLMIGLGLRLIMTGGDMRLTPR